MKTYFFYIKDFIDALYNKNKGVATVVFAIILFFSFRLLFYNVDNLVKKAVVAKKTSDSNKIRIEDLEYHARKEDKNNEDQKVFNREISAKISYMEGVVHFMLDKNDGGKN